MRDCDAESFGSFEVGDKLKLSRLLDGQVARLRAFENSVDVARCPAGKVGGVRPIRHEAPGFCKFPQATHHGQPMFYREACQLSAMKKRHRVRQDQESLGAFRCHRAERVVEGVGTTHL